MNILVQKFGGTSLASEKMREAAVLRIKEAIREGYRPVAVVSAMGRAGDPYATDTLKNLAEKTYPALPLRELDLLMSCGEIISAVVVAAALHRSGVKARAFTGAQAGLITDGNYGGSQVVSCRPEPLLRCLEEGEVAVVAGFQGASPAGEINTLGRGGSDTTAVILGAALQAERVEIYTDVNGISTADPRLLEEAQVIPQISYSEVCQLAYEGARVIHPAAVEVAMKHNLDVVVRGLTEAGPGTLISMRRRPEGGFSAEPQRVVTGIAHDSAIAQLVVELAEPDPALEMRMFDSLGRAGVSIDLISVFPRLKVFTVKEDVLPRAAAVLEELGVNFRAEKGCAKVSVVGLGMPGIPGVMAGVVKALHDKKISILQTSDSNITISLLIKQQDLVPAVRALHAHFALGEAHDAYPQQAAISS